jgi:hypothetical protein
MVWHRICLLFVIHLSKSKKINTMKSLRNLALVFATAMITLGANAQATSTKQEGKPVHKEGEHKEGEHKGDKVEHKGGEHKSEKSGEHKEHDKRVGDHKGGTKGEHKGGEHKPKDGEHKPADKK